ncbi:syntaxin, putative [Ichthyophthirius multifiliis]|uniref:Syntaxin, putative n=1 Tax=Ichthyophthirius multifiliis TaxID=5932 RepID=G0QXI0_ICHMU|nr:syntaxin, putative [Ichthyophthirius multifiliis]EGR30072.1 syntaxin, putative [Ichthyophthirius multifiliis]|eukprot:XP_004031308.1 syntaxin, putative [Ichthyophthirius multifiliis]
MITKKVLGYWQNKTDYFKKVKRDLRQKKDRFRKKVIYDNDSTDNSSGTGKKTSESQSIEINQPISLYDLPPIWVEVHHNTNKLIQEIIEIKRQITELSNKRIRKQFNDNNNLDQQINDLATKAAKKLRECEQNLKQIDLLAASQKEEENEQKIRENVKRSLAYQIQELTVDLRRQQKALYDTLKKYDNVGQVGQKYQQNQASLQLENSMQQDLLDMYENIAKERDEEINKLIDTINELSSIFQQLGNLIIDQGTVLDRIDFNVQDTKKNTQQATKHLRKVVEYQESPLAKKCIQLLIISIIIFTFILALRYKS